MCVYSNGSYKSVTWESSNELISVTEDGKCTPTKNESCYGLITCTVEDHFGNKYQDTVWVSYAFNPVTEVVVSPATISGAIGSTYQLSKTIKPEGTGLAHIGAASIKNVYWESDDENIATVDENGLVTFVSAGATTVRCVSYTVNAMYHQPVTVPYLKEELMNTKILIIKTMHMITGKHLKLHMKLRLMPLRMIL